MQDMQVTVSEAARLLHMTTTTVRVLMRQERLPIGYVKTGPSGRHTYLIYREMLNRELERQGHDKGTETEDYQQSAGGCETDP